MKEEKEEELKEAKELFKEGLKKIFKATAKVSKKIVEGFREGYAEDVTKKKIKIPNPKFQAPNKSQLPDIQTTKIKGTNWGKIVTQCSIPASR